MKPDPSPTTPVDCDALVLPNPNPEPANTALWDEVADHGVRLARLEAEVGRLRAWVMQSQVRVDEEAVLRLLDT